MDIENLIDQPVLVEHVLDLGDEAHVMIVVPEGVNFTLTDDSALGGKPINKWLSQPRALDENGEPRIDLFSVILRSRCDRDNFKAGDRKVLLIRPLPTRTEEAEQGGGADAEPAV